MSKTQTPVLITFWGVRGSIAAPGAATLRYGGNTSCVEVRQGGQGLVLDAGTGIRALGLKFDWKGQGNIPILVSHDHMDHIGGLPFFEPAFHKRQKINIYGPRGIKKALKNLFPFSVLLSQRKIHEVSQGELRGLPMKVEAFPLNHPGGALGYRIETASGKKILYISDHEPDLSSEKKLLSKIQGADLLIMDAQYLDHEYKKRRGWGHSSVASTVMLALKARVKHLILFHHDPEHSDRTLEKKLKMAKSLIRRAGSHLKCQLAREGLRMTL